MISMTDPIMAYPYCQICGDNDCPGIYDEIYCPEYEEDDWDDDEPHFFVGINDDAELYEGHYFDDDRLADSENFGIDEGE